MVEAGQWICDELGGSDASVRGKLKESLTGVPREFNADHKHIFGAYL
jgi:hypothetical protein